jgi:ATP-dependent RNA circularization protein (DNA/RNA ligase family)
MAYRDVLIDKWTKNAREVTEEIKGRLMKEFPFVQLLEYISRDIMFANYYCEGKKETKDITDLLGNRVINPIASSRRWYMDSYEKVTKACEKFYEKLEEKDEISEYIDVWTDEEKKLYDSWKEDKKDAEKEPEL